MDAAEASKVLRRAGLLTGLERAAGYPPERYGSVVEQDPAPGSIVARAALVRLYVAAPPVGEEPGGGEPATPQEESSPNTSSAVGESRPPAPAPAPRSRKPRPPARERSSRPADTRTAEPRATEAGVRARAGEPVDVAAEQESGEGLEDELARADDLFAGRAAPPAGWRRLYPDRDGLTVGVRLRRLWRSRWARLAGVMLAVWLIAGLLAALGGHAIRSRASARTTHARALQSPVRRAPLRERKRASSQRSSASVARAGRRRGGRAQHVRIAAPVHRVPAAPGNAATAGARAVAVSRAMAVAQDGGGPFSP